MNILPELFEMQRIYHRAIFDCLNEAVSYPMIVNEDGYIKRLLKRNKIVERKTLPEELFDKLHYCKDIVLEWSSLLCGIIRDKEDSMMGNIKFMEPEVINQLREERLFRFLSIEVGKKNNCFRPLRRRTLGLTTRGRRSEHWLIAQIIFLRRLWKN